MADYVAQAIARLRRNNPSETDFKTCLSHFSDDDDLTEALRTNDHVNDIFLCLGELPDIDSNWDSLLRALATRENLEKVSLNDDHREDGTRNPPERVTPFLLAMQQNPSMHTVRLEDLQLSGDSIASFLDTAAFVTTLELVGCDMEAPGSLRAVAAALKRNTNIQRLELTPRNGYVGMLPIANSLAAKASPLEFFSVGCIISRNMCMALIASIPAMQVRTLELTLDSSLQDMKGDIIQTIQRNASLHRVVAKLENSEDLFDDTDKMTLISCFSRNEFLAQWVENPYMVPRAAWPEYLAMAQTTGPDTISGILQALTNLPASWFEGEQRRTRRRADLPV
jgi:hypothetical protein